MAEAITVDSYRQRLAARMANGAALAHAAYMAFGDGGHNADLTPKTPSKTATALSHEILRKSLTSIAQEDLFSVTCKGVIEASELVGARISEAGIFDSNSQLIGIKTFAPKLKESDEKYEISIKLRF